MKKFNSLKSNNSPDFEKLALEIFQFQAKNNSVYKKFIELLNIKPSEISRVTDIPFLPIEFFKSHKIVSSVDKIQQIFLSSGTTGSSQSQHFVTDLSLYEESFTKGFEYFY